MVKRIKPNNTQSNNSFNTIYSNYYRKSFLFVQSYVHDTMAAEDIVSDSLIKLWEHLNHEEINPIEPYLFTILKNRSLDYLKHVEVKKSTHGKMANYLERELQLRITSLETSDPKEIFSNEIQEIVDKTLGYLPQKTKEIFLLSRFGNNSQKEIAKLYSISIKGVEYHIMQAMKELKLALIDYLPVVCLFFIFLS